MKKNLLILTILLAAGAGPVPADSSTVRIRRCFFMVLRGVPPTSQL